MSISIIIPTKNAASNLRRLLISILKAKTPPKEIIVVDNHSADGTRRIARRIWKQREQENFVPDLPKLTILTKGPERSVQKNWGAKKAKGTHLLFLDADMEVSQGLITELQQFSTRDARAAIIPEDSIGQDFWGKAVALERNCYQGKPLVEAPRFLKKKTFLDIGGYDVNLIAGEDWDLAKRLEDKGAHFYRTKRTLLHHEATGFTPSLQRKWYYTQRIEKYAQKHPRRFARQSSFWGRLLIFWHARQKLARHPAQTSAFLFIKTIIFIRWKLSRT